jgi:transcription elongation factor GreA
MTNTGRVIFGATVELINTETDARVTYQIVGDEEANLKEQKISVNSPISRALIAKHEGDIVLVHAPAGEIEYEIAQVSYL